VSITRFYLGPFTCTMSSDDGELTPGAGPSTNKPVQATESTQYKSEKAKTKACGGNPTDSSRCFTLSRIGCRGYLRSNRQRSRPLIPGIITSKMRRSGSRSALCSRVNASAPLMAFITRIPALCSMREMTNWFTALSSTQRIVGCTGHGAAKMASVV
jgi:hypothetical protein